MKKTLLVVWLMVLTMALAVALTAPRAAAQAARKSQRRRRHVPLSHLFQMVRRLPHRHPNIQINYQSIGSGGGIRQLQAGTVDFGASDGPMTDEQLAESKFKILHFPTVLGAVVPTYNIPGVTADLNFTQKALAGIYLGTITKWNDPEIAKANPGVSLPGNDIVVVHRSDGSGTSYIWTDFLSKVSDDWKSKVGKPPPR